MSDSFIGEIRMWGPNFAPLHWTFCNGQILAVSGNEALFSLLGTNFGGNGISNFGLPDMRGRAPVHFGTGPGLTPRPIGQQAGVERVTLDITQIPSHTHNLQASDSTPTSTTFADKVNAKYLMYDDLPGSSTYGDMPAGTIGTNNNNPTESHSNMMPWLSISFILSLKGTYPQRN